MFDHPHGHEGEGPMREEDAKEMSWEMGNMKMHIEQNPDGSSSLRLAMGSLKLAATTAVGLLGVAS